MAASQADESLLTRLRDRVGPRVTDWRPGARVRSVSPLTGGPSSLTFLVEIATATATLALSAAGDEARASMLKSIASVLPESGQEKRKAS